jgi:hypothetical protein
VPRKPPLRAIKSPSNKLDLPQRFENIFCGPESGVLGWF